jgi:hypothetical protein
MSDGATPVLKPGQLFEQRSSRDRARLRAYNQLLEQIYTKIKSASRVAANNWIIYTVPPFVLGLPKIDLQDCVVYIVFQLRQAGYEVRYTYPNLLYVSWKHHERNYILQESPIMKAMLPPAKPSTEQGPQRGQEAPRKTIRFQDPASWATGASFLPPQQAQARSAGEYNPPNSFLTAITGTGNPQRQNTVNDLLQF